MAYNDYGYMRVAAASPRVKLADPAGNAEEIVRMCRQLASEGVSVAVFPELCTTGYGCADLFAQRALLCCAGQAVRTVAERTADLGLLVAVGTPVLHAGRLYNCAAILKGGKLLGLVPKIYLPNAAEFYEARWFESGASVDAEIEYAGQKTRLCARQLFHMGKAVIGVEICQDLWVPLPPCTFAALAGANLILNLSASNEALCKHNYRKSLVSNTSARLNAAYIYASCGYGESTQDLVWAGSSLIYENGVLLAEAARFNRESSIICADVDLERLDTVRSKNTNFKDSLNCGKGFSTVEAGAPLATDFEASLLRNIDAHPFVPEGPELKERCAEILSIQVLGLCNRLEHIGSKTAVVGISGGLDSTLALLVTALAFDKLGWDRSRIIGITMPGFGTSARTKGNADILMKKLGITRREISIVPAVTQHLNDIAHSLDNHDATYENAQARERTQILMDVAGQEGGIVIGTGDLSELALGWCTYNGDHMSMYGVNASVPKTLVRTLVAHAAASKGFEGVAEVLKDIIDTPISPELLPAGADGSIQQVTEDLVGPYELHDFFLYNIMRWGFAPAKVLFLARKTFAGKYKESVLVKWLKVFYKRFFSQQFKRSCLPDGPKVGSVSLSPRGDWRMPSDAQSSLWIREAEEL